MLLFQLSPSHIKIIAPQPYLTKMKRSSTIANLDDSIGTELGNCEESRYNESVMVTSMTMLKIAEESQLEHRLLRKQRPSGSMCSMSASSSFNSRGSLRGWGSSTSRKSYKVDLCSLAANDFHGEHTTSRLSSSNIKMNRSNLLTLKKLGANNSKDTSETNHAFDSWGFFLE